MNLNNFIANMDLFFLSHFFSGHWQHVWFIFAQNVIFTSEYCFFFLTVIKFGKTFWPFTVNNNNTFDGNRLIISSGFLHPWERRRTRRGRWLRRWHRRELWQCHRRRRGQCEGRGQQTSHPVTDIFFLKTRRFQAINLLFYFSSVTQF